MTWPHALRSLRHRDLRLLLAAQTVSLVGTWMQSVAQGWLVYRLTHSTRLLGLVGFLAQVPVFLFAVWAGSLADRVPRRRIVLVTQVNALVQATLLAVLTVTGTIRPWMLLPLSAMLGLTYAFEIPARQALLGEIAGDQDMPNALALNSSVVNGARVVGPALAGWIVAFAGEGACFALNAVSFAGTIYAVAVMRTPAPRPHAGSRRGHLLEGLLYARRSPHVVALLALLATSSFFALPYVTLLPVLAKDVLGGDARVLGLLQACAGVGALAAGISLMTRSGLRGLGRRVGVGASLLGLGLAGVSLSRSAPISCAFLVLAGFGYLTQTAGTMTLLQGLAPEEMRGRVMGIFSMLFVGTTPFGALAGGMAAAHFGAPRVLLAGALVLVAASAAFHLALPWLRREVRARHAALFPPPPVP